MRQSGMGTNHSSVGVGPMQRAKFLKVIDYLDYYSGIYQ